MGKAVKSIGSALGFGGGGGGAGPKLNRSAFDITKQAKEYEDRLKEQAAATAAQNKALSEALAQQARGEGPLAGAAMRAAASRNLAQTLAAAQSAPSASPLAARQIMQFRGQQSRDLAQLGLQERLAAQEALGSQLARAAETGRADIGQGFGIAKSPQEMLADYEKQRFTADVARRQGVQQQQTSMLSALMSAAGQAGAAALGKPAATGAYITQVDKQPVKGARYAAPTEAHGNIIPGNADHKNDSVENDTELRRLSPGEMVVPATVVAKGPKEIRKFAEKLLELEKQNPSPMNGYATLVALRKGKKNG